jgi:hypothetical protein
MYVAIPCNDPKLYVAILCNDPKFFFHLVDSTDDVILELIELIRLNQVSIK